MSEPPYTLSIKEFTIQSLWDDYERRTWHYNSVGQNLSRANRRLLHWVGSIDRSGYTRETCLRVLIASYRSGDENRILLRLTDWVPQVQAIAREWTITHFKLLPLEDILANQKLILYLSRKQRLQADPAMREIKRNLLERVRSMDLREFFYFNAIFRRFLFLQSLTEDGYLRRWILEDSAPFNRLLLLNHVEYSDLSNNEIQKLGMDKSVFVRRCFLRKQLDAGITLDREQLLAMALDRSRSLRDMGQYYLKAIYQEDAYGLYQASDGETFFYIADYGRKEDADHFIEGIRHGLRSTQYNCLRALASTMPERLKELDLSLLVAQNSKFRAVLTPVLPKILSLEEILALRSAFKENYPYATVSFLRMIEKKSFWAFVDEGLDVLLLDPPPALSKAIIRAIKARVTIYEVLSVERRGSISRKISTLRGDRRHEEITNQLEFIMKTS